MTSMLLQPITLGELELKNRIIMAPLTRCRAVEQRIPNEVMAEYYGQRSSAGLIISEATSISPMAVGYPDTPGIWNEAQVEGWLQVTNKVQKNGGKILCQLWHVGRMSDPIFLDGKLPQAPSAIAPAGNVSLVRPEKPYVTPKAVTEAEIKDIVEDYRQAAENAKQAGFDGVEIHAANGYLIDQFLQDSTNTRIDNYGGSIANRCRFLFEVLEAVLSVWPAGKVGIHLSPRADIHDMGDSDLETLFLHVAAELSRYRLAFICTRENFDTSPLSPRMRMAFRGALIANEGFDFTKAEQAVAQNQADAVAFGRDFISNPDLPLRYQDEIPLTTPIDTYFYQYETGLTQGYTDYDCANTKAEVVELVLE